MKYGMLPVKIIPFEVPVLPKNTQLSGNIVTTIFKYPSDNIKKHPLMIAWKYRLNRNGEHLFTYIAESRFMIEDDGIPFVYTQLDRFIGDLYINVEIGWENQTKNTPLQGTTMPNLIGENLDVVRKQIIDMLK